MRQRLSLWRRNLKDTVRAVAKTLPARSSADGVENVARLAEGLTQIDRDELLVSDVVLQKNLNSIVRRFDIRSASAPGRDPVLQLVEKRSRNLKEYRLYRHFASSRNGLGRRIAPRVHLAKRYWLTNPDDYRSLILIDHLAGCGLPDYSEAAAHRLADKMSLISSLPAEEMPWVPKAENRLTPELLNDFVEAATAKGHVESPEAKSLIEAMRRDWHRISALPLDRLPAVPCHNDLHVKNLGVQRIEGRNEYLFFDWEKFGLNYLGSDLHHFLCKSISEPEFKPFFDTLNARYKEIVCKKHRVDERYVDLAALSYGLFRCMTRSVMHKDNKRRRSQMNQVATIFGRMKELL